MGTWNKISKTSSNKIVAVIFVFIGLLGFLDATYLTIGHYRHTVPPCSIIHGCSRVLTSQYSAFIGVPVALVGAFYYLFILWSALAYWWGAKRDSALYRAAQMTTVGLLASLYFLALQIFVLHAYCLYCLGSIGTATMLFVAGRWVKRSPHYSPFLLRQKSPSVTIEKS